MRRERVDFKKGYRHLFTPSSMKPSIVEVPEFNYAVLTGVGDPNTSEYFSNAVEAIYDVAYAIRMRNKQEFNIPGYYEYVVPPLEGLWDTIDGQPFSMDEKNRLKWTIGIMQPEFVTEKVLEQAKEIAYVKKKNELIKAVKLVEQKPHLACTLLHMGSYDEENESFDQMMAYISEKGYTRTSHTHREIYLNDFRKTAPEKLKTVLRFRIK
jgi:hypothetical protein